MKISNTGLLQFTIAHIFSENIKIPNARLQHMDSLLPQNMHRRSAEHSFLQKQSKSRLLYRFFNEHAHQRLHAAPLSMNTSTEQVRP